MKSSSVMCLALSGVLLCGCSTFSDVDFDQQASQTFEVNTGAVFDLTADKPKVLLSDLFAVGEASRLIELALHNNPSLQQTRLSLQIAKQRLTVEKSAQWPVGTIGLNSSKNEGSVTRYTPSLDVSWTVDIWRQLSDSTKAQDANVYASTYAYQGARDLLVARIMQGYLSLVQMAQLREIETKRLEVLKTNQDVILGRYRKGLTDLKDLDTAKSSIQSSQSTLLDYQEAYQQARRNLALLTGLVENEIEYRTQYPVVNMPIESLSVSTIGRRPDLQQAYQNIIAGQYQHKVAYKALLPSFSLSGSLSNSNTSLHDALFGSGAWQLLGQLSAPLFNAGKLRSEVEIAKLNAEINYWAFQEKLVSAINEVDNAVAQEKSLAGRLQFTEQALQSLKRSEVTYTQRYSQGTVSLIDLLQIQQQVFALQVQVNQLTFQQLNNRITLGLALGLGA